MKPIELRKLDIEISNEFDEDLKVQGYIATSEPSHILGKENGKKWREVILPGTFQKALNKAKRIDQDVDFLADHDKKQILASTGNQSFFLEEDDIGLYIEATISPTTWGKNMYVLIKDNIVKGLSFGMRVLMEDWTVGLDNIPLRTISEIELFEVSALRTPAYPGTLIENRGIEIATVNIPKDLEKRDFNNAMLCNEQDVTPQMFYNGMVLIAEKLDNIVKKMEVMDTAKTVEGLVEAKQVLVEAKAVAATVAPQINTMDENAPAAPLQDPNIAVEEPKGIVEENADLPDEKKDFDENGEEVKVDGEVKPDEEVAANEETKVDEEAKPDEVKVEDETKVEGEGEVKTEVDTEAKPGEKPEEVKVDAEEKVAEPETEEEKKKKQVEEFRSWIPKKYNITEEI